MKPNHLKNVILIFFICAITIFPSNKKRIFLLKRPSTPIINLSSSNFNNVSFSVKIDGISTSEKKIDTVKYDYLSIPGADVITREGSPQLPVITKLVAVPDCDNISVTVSSSNESSFFNYNILPAPSYEKKKFPDGSEDLAPVFKENNSIYSSNSDFPDVFGKIIETGYIRDQKVARIAIYPVQYNPVSKEIKVFSDFNVTLSFVNPKSSVNKEMGIFRDMLHHAALNYKPNGINASTKLSAAINSSKSAKTQSVTSKSGSVIRVTDLSKLVGANAIPVDYLIITHSSLFNSGSLTKLANHRKDYNGYDVAIVKVNDDVYNSYPASKHFISIRNFIRDVYLHGKADHTGDGHLAYILLVGDAYLDDNTTEMLPAAYPSFYSNDEKAGDYYYACTGGDSDNLLDLMYGRLPAGNEKELSNVVNKIISYEYNTNSSWRNNYTFVAGSYGMFYSYADLAIKRMTDMIPSSRTKSYAYRALVSDHPSMVTGTDSVFGQRFTLKEYEDLAESCGSRKLSDWVYNDPVAGINNGVHTFIYEGHGSWNGLGGESCGRQIFKVKDCIAPYDNTVENRLHNNLYTFMIFCACNAGHFDNGPDDEGDCIAETVLNLQNRGAIGVIGSTRDSDMGSFGFVDGKILDEEINDSTYIMGEAFMESKLCYTYIKYKRQYNLYGDPALDLWPLSSGNKILTSNLDSTSNLSPKKYILFNNYPNPFNPSTTIKYNLPDASSVEITIYDIIGNMIKDFTISYQTAGQHSILWNGTNRNNEQVASGIYLYHFNAVSLADKNNKFEKTAKMILMK